MPDMSVHEQMLAERERGMATERPLEDMNLDNLNEMLHDCDAEIARMIQKRERVRMIIRNKLENAEKLLAISMEKYHSAINSDSQPMPAMEADGYDARAHSNRFH